MFARVGIPREMLTDQGANFQSRLLAELYRLLHVEGICTSPYHPQTDGLVERFNQTLKAMLCKFASEQGKDWDKLVPYLLFAYHEVPQKSTGFSPFELLYGRDVRGLLDVLKETWVSDQKNSPDVVSYVLKMRERMDATSELVQGNLKSIATQQKRWYDRNTREWAFQAGDRVLVLLPTSTLKLTAQWQGPGEVVKAFGKVNYLVRMPGRRNPEHLFHVNMLQRWHDRTPSVLLGQAVPIPSDLEEVPVWNEADEEHTRMGKHLSAEQAAEFGSLLGEFEGVFQVLPGHTTLTEHWIITKDTHPVQLAPYRIPHAYCDDVKQELEEMLECGIIEPSTSDWSSPLVTVKKDGSLHLCVDYQRLNSVSKMDAYPMPRVEDLIDKVAGAPFITTLDLTKGYWQVPVAVQDHEKTNFQPPMDCSSSQECHLACRGHPPLFSG